MAKPEIRLKGFEGEWEDVCFRDITYLAGTKNRDNLPLPSYSITNENGFVPQNEQFENGGTMANADKRMYYIVTPDTFAYNPARINVGSIGYDDLDKDVIVSSLYVIFKTDCKTNNYFLDKWFKTPHFKKLINLYQEGGVRLYFFYDKLCQCHLFRPELKEQQSIANYFKSLDSMIQGVTKKIASLKQMKQACLVSMFPQAGETTPRVRFKGFKGEWEKHALADIAKFSKGSGYSKNDLCDSGTPIILYGRLYTRYNTQIDNVDTFAIQKPNSVLSEGNEIIVPASGETPEDIACAAVVNQQGVILGGDLNVIRLDKDFDSYFTSLVITYGDVHYELAKYAQGKSVVHLHNSDICKASISYPSLKEQQQIASFFRSLDSQISLQEARLEKLKQIKSACLDKMFV